MTKEADEHTISLFRAYHPEVNVAYNTLMGSQESNPIVRKDKHDFLSLFNDFLF